MKEKTQAKKTKTFVCKQCRKITSTTNSIIRAQELCAACRGRPLEFQTQHEKKIGA